MNESKLTFNSYTTQQKCLEFIPPQCSSSDASEQSTTPLHTELLLRQRPSEWHRNLPGFSHAAGEGFTTPATVIQIHTHCYVSYS